MMRFPFSNPPQTEHPVQTIRRRRTMIRTAKLLVLLAAVTAPGVYADGLTGEVKLSRLNWSTDGVQLNRAGLSGLFRREVDISAVAIDTYIGYRFDHNRSISSAIGFLYGRGLNKTEVQEFGMVDSYRFKSWFGIGYKGFYNIIDKPDLDLFWHFSLVDFNLDARQFVEGSTDPGTSINGLFSGWGYGFGMTITQFLISYNIYTVNPGTCASCSNTTFQMISLGWQFN